MFTTIKKYHEEEDKEIELMSVVEQRLHRQRGELIQLVGDLKLIIDDIADCSCDACAANKGCNFWLKYQDFLKKLE